MGVRFHKSAKIAPGVKVNIPRTGPSLSLGPQGASVNLSRQGVRLTLALAGTGLGYIAQRSWKGLRRP